MNKMNVTEDEWLAELEALGVAAPADEPPGLFSASDWARKKGRTRNWATQKIGELIDAGKVEYAGRYPRPDRTGRMQPTPLYRLKGD